MTYVTEDDLRSGKPLDLEVVDPDGTRRPLSAFLETVVGEFMRMQARAFAGDGYEGVTHAGIAIVAADSGRVLLAQRTFDPTDDPEVAETWEFPGGGLEDGEDPFTGAVRELIEETGWGLPEDSRVVNGWRADGRGDDQYQGFVVRTHTEFPLDGWTPTEEVQAVAWVDPVQLTTMHPDINIRPEMRDFDTSLFDAARNEDSMTEDIAAATQVGTADEYLRTDDDGNELARVSALVEEEPMLGLLDFASEPIPVHGVLAPEEVESGDSRGFNAGAMTRRGYRLPFMWQKGQTQGHNNAVVVGSVDRLMRKDGLIHWEGLLMPSPEADDFAGVLAFFGRFPVSVDGDKGNLDMGKSEQTGVVWFDAVRASGLTAVAVSAFPEAYVAFGPHPDMPQDGALTASMVEAGDMVTFAESFDRGPGWVTNPEDTKRIHDYWMPGHEGGAKIRWGTPGDFTRCTRLVGEKIAKNSPEKAGYIKQVCAQWHHDALGYWPGDLGKPGNAPDTPENRRRAATHADAETLDFSALDDLAFKEYTDKERKNANTLPDGSFPIEDCADLRNAIRAIGRAKDPAKAKAHIRSRKSALGCTDVDLPESWGVSGNPTFSIDRLPADDPIRGEAYCAAGCGTPAEYSVSSDDPDWFGLYCEEHASEYEGKSLFADYEDAIEATEGIETTDDGWEAVLVSSAAGGRVLPPPDYFSKHPDTGALVIEEPDENGIRRTYGYAGEWGVCHIGFDGRCVEVPVDPDGEFSNFHLGYTRTTEGTINTGVITYKVDHRAGQRILTETPEQQHFDNVAHAWAAVRLGMDDRGIWFSGVVLSHVSEDDLTLIEATGQVSGEWKYSDLRALQSVNVPGFAVTRASAHATYDAEGKVDVLVASTFGATSDCAPTPKEMMAALAKADAEARMEALRASMKGED